MGRDVRLGRWASPRTRCVRAIGVWGVVGASQSVEVFAFGDAVHEEEEEGEEGEAEHLEEGAGDVSEEEPPEGRGLAGGLAALEHAHDGAAGEADGQAAGEEDVPVFLGDRAVAAEDGHEREQGAGEGGDTEAGEAAGGALVEALEGAGLAGEVLHWGLWVRESEVGTRAGVSPAAGMIRLREAGPQIVAAETTSVGPAGGR